MQIQTQNPLNAEFKRENPRYIKEQLITYIGNKRKLLSFIEKAIIEAQQRNPGLDQRFADVFAGTGVVSSMARQYFKNLYINDLESYSALTNRVYHTNKSEVDEAQYTEELRQLHADIEDSFRSGFITELYAPKDEKSITKEDRVFYTRRNARYIDTARQLIAEKKYDYSCFFIASLIQQASVHTNTSGVFKGFYKNRQGIGQFGGDRRNALARITTNIQIEPIILSEFEREVSVFNLDAEEFLEQCGNIDIAYFDPPYNQHPYGSNYFMLNTILEYQRPSSISRVSGIPNDWKKSQYNQRAHAKSALFSALRKCSAKVILLSYNSEGYIPVDELIEEASELGAVKRFDEKYNTFRGCRNLRERSAHVTEHLIMIERT